MNLAISNIGWKAEDDQKVYCWMQQYGFKGLEIAPTRIIPGDPYDHVKMAKEWKEELQRQYAFCVPSMQSIWYGRSEKIFGTPEERQFLLDYTKKAIDFASEIGCGNLVFGCPKNRVWAKEEDKDIGIRFFKELADYAFSKNTVIGLEANPTIYNTNYVNTTQEAIELIEQVHSQGFLLNLDIGTMIANEENLDIVRGKVHLINHVHISEPWLKVIQKRDIHVKLKDLLEEEKYSGFISIEMGNVEEMQDLRNAMQYVKDVMGNDI